MPDLRAQLIPAEILPLFDDRFVRSCELIDEHTYRLALDVARRAGLDAALRAGAPATAAELAAAAAVAPGARRALDWLLAFLAAHGALARAGDAFVLERPLPALDPAETADAQRANDPSCLPAFALADAAAAAWPDVLRGAPGEDALFSPERSGLWPLYFSNDNPLYGVTNALAARAAAARAPRRPLTILELGGGLGSAAQALVERFDADARTPEVARYRFTELAPPFFRRGQRAATAAAAGRFALEAARLDMDRPFAEQGVAPESVDLVYAVNTVHVARDLPFTLAEIRAALRPGGAVVLGECLRPFAGRPVYTEFAFLLLEAFRARGFLTPGEWTAALAAAGFAAPEVYPDLERLRDPFPLFVAGAVGALRP